MTETAETTEFTLTRGDLHFVKRIDDRRNRKYAIVVRVFMPLDAEGVDVSGLVPRPIMGRNYSAATLRWVICAERPSEILSEEAAFDLVEPQLAEIADRVRTHRAAREDRERREKLAREASQLVEWLADNVKARAKKAVRFEQRLAGLMAELEAEIALTAVEDLRGEITMAPEQGGFQPEAVELAYTRCNDYAAKTVMPRGLPRIGGSALTVEDVETFEQSRGEG